MTVLPYGPHQYKVVSEGNVYWVDLKAEGAANLCDCPAQIWKGGLCKHVKAALDYEDQNAA